MKRCNLIICQYCFQEMKSRGEVKKYFNVDEDRIQALDIPIICGDYNEEGNFIADEYGNDDYVKCEMCNEMYLIDELVEI